MRKIPASLTTDVAVVGGGVVGSAVAYELSAAGLGVVLLDAALAGRASDAGAGIASPQTFAEADPEWYHFGAAAADHLRLLQHRLQHAGAEIGPDVFTECGSLVIALAEHEDPWFEEVLRLAQGRDAQITEVSPSVAQDLFPPLCRPWRAMLSPRSARVDGRRLTEALRAAASRQGTTVLHHQVHDIDTSGKGSPHVVTEDVTVACHAVVVAAGAWSTALASAVGAAVPVSPTKGEIVHVALPADHAVTAASGGWPIVQPVLNFYLVPWSNGRVACGGTFEPGAGFDVRPTAKGVRDLLRECLTIAPGLAEASVVETRVGLRPFSPDDRPLLGALPGAPHVHVCTGHGANGLLLGAYSAWLVAQAIVTGAAPEAMAAFAPDRFDADAAAVTE